MAEKSGGNRAERSQPGRGTDNRGGRRRDTTLARRIRNCCFRRFAKNRRQTERGCAGGVRPGGTRRCREKPEVARLGRWGGCRGATEHQFSRYEPPTGEGTRRRNQGATARSGGSNGRGDSQTA